MMVRLTKIDVSGKIFIALESGKRALGQGFFKAQFPSKGFEKP